MSEIDDEAPGAIMLKQLKQRAAEGVDGVLIRVNDADYCAFLLEETAALLRAGTVVALGEFVVRLPKTDYQEYIGSDEWKAKADAARAGADHRCQVCNSNSVILDVHHRTYERLGRESPSDLIALCRECHGLFHKNGKLAR